MSIKYLTRCHSDVDAETMIRDVTPFLQTLIERRLVRVVNPGESRMKAKTMRRIYLRKATVMLVAARPAVRFAPSARVFAWTSRPPRRIPAARPC